MTTEIKSTKNFVENTFTLEPRKEDEVSKGDSKGEAKYGSSFLLSFASFTGNTSYRFCYCFLFDKLEILITAKYK